MLYVWIVLSMAGGTMNADTDRKVENSQYSVVSLGTPPRSRNITVYLGYANNPFGASTRLHNRMAKYYTTENPKYHFTHNSRTTINDMHSLANAIDTISNENTMQEGRTKRGVINLYNMVSCATGCTPLIYKGYGCYCGFLGSGYAVDGIDSCCRRHDLCYNTVNCPLYLEYFVPYFWKCHHKRPICAIEHGQWGGRGSCAHRLCECDRILSECLNQYPCPTSRAVCQSSSWRYLQNALMLF